MRYSLPALICIVLSLHGCSGDNGTVSSYDPSWDEQFKQGSEACTRNQYGRAAAFFQQAIETAEMTDPNDLRIATVACYYAVMQAKRGKLKDAELLYRNALSIDEIQLPPNNPDLQQLRRDLAGILRREGKGAEARRIMAGARVGKKGKGKNAPVLVASSTKSKVHRTWPAVSDQDKAAANTIDMSGAGIMGDNGVSDTMNAVRNPMRGGTQEVVKQ